MMAAQSAPSQPTGQSSGMSGMSMGSGQKSEEMSGMHQHMQQMQADMQQMKSRVDKMRSDAEKVQDANTKAALLDNADMWEQFMTRMQSHMQMMQGMHQSGMKGTHHKKTPPATGQSPTPTPQ